MLHLIWLIEIKGWIRYHLLPCCCSVAQLHTTLCDPMDCITPGFPVLHLLPELAQTHIHWIGDAMQQSRFCCPLLLLLSIFPSIRFFPKSQLFASGDQSIGASASILPMNIQGWFHLGLTGLISLHSKGLSWVFSNTTAWKHQFFSAQPSLGFPSRPLRML